MYKLGKFCWAKLSRYSHYMDFPSNTFMVQGQGAYMLYLEQKIDEKNFCALLKTTKTAKVLPSEASLFTV